MRKYENYKYRILTILLYYYISVKFETFIIFI